MTHRPLTHLVARSTACPVFLFSAQRFKDLRFSFFSSQCVRRYHFSFYHGEAACGDESLSSTGHSGFPPPPFFSFVFDQRREVFSPKDGRRRAGALQARRVGEASRT